MKSSSRQTAAEQGSSEVFALLEKRATIEQWLARLDSQRGSVSEKIIQRVQADYERRLADTLQSLGSHRSALEDQLLSASDRLSIAESRRVETEEQLEEGRLRNAIGELEDAEWAEEQVALEGAVQQAAAAAGQLDAEVARLTELMSQLNHEERGIGSGIDDSVGGTMILDGAAEATVEEPAIVVAPDTYPESGATGAGLFDHPGQDDSGSVAVDEDPFLASIDRVLLGDGGAEDKLPIGIGDDEPLEDTAPKPGLKCGECGYTNDLSAWFCGVCGADVG